ncbi:MAG: molybdenum cofactor guanylyltransferase [Deltaproteobacteria bacterium]|nr:molybdenum cofactor guanylyltransferase [Deltaproteobacteria bacterium]
MSNRIALAAILAGGKARRMGRDKVTLDVGGIPMVEHVFNAVSGVAESVVLVGGGPALADRGVPTIADRYPGTNAIGGVATALAYATETVGRDTPVLCVACDMPLLEPALLDLLRRLQIGWDAAVPRTASGYEPLCAVYRAGALPAFEAEIARGNLRVYDAYPALRVREVSEEELRRADPTLRSFLNVNRPEDLSEVRARLRA